jgi:hypothetical protein
MLGITIRAAKRRNTAHSPGSPAEPGVQPPVHDVPCRGCGRRPIVGPRFRSLACGLYRNVNFCLRCHDGGLYAPAFGPFRRIETPQRDYFLHELGGVPPLPRPAHCSQAKPRRSRDGPQRGAAEWWVPPPLAGDEARPSGAALFSALQGDGSDADLIFQVSPSPNTHARMRARAPDARRPQHRCCVGWTL